MSVALSDDQADAAAIRQAKVDFARKLTELGVRSGMVEQMAELNDFAIASGVQAIEDAELATLTPDPANDKVAVLKKQLESDRPPKLTIIQPLVDGRTERIELSIVESKKYLTATVDVREGMRVGKIRERHARVALDAARKLAERGGVFGPGILSNDEEVCLREFAGLELREDGSEKLRDRARRTLIRAISEGNTSLAKLREFGGWDQVDMLAAPSRVIGGLVGPGRDGLSDDGAAYQYYGANLRQMYLSEVWDEQAKARFAYARDPVAKAAVHIKCNYILGRGFDVTCTDVRVQAVVDEFLDRHTRWRKWLSSTIVMGELFLRKLLIPGGKCEHVKVPAQTIWEVVTESDDTTKVLYYVQRYTTRAQMFAPVGQYTSYIERIIPATAMIHFKLNDEEDEVRGRSEIYAALPWHHRYRTHWDAQIEKAFASAAYTTYAKLNGNQRDVNAFLAMMPKGRPRAGQALAFNQKVEEFGILKADSSSNSGTGSTSEGILSTIAMSYGFAKEYFGVTGNRSRGGAVVAEGPAQKTFESGQDAYGSDCVEPVIQQAIDEASLPGGELAEVEDKRFKVEFPEIIKSDSMVKVQILQVGRANGYVSQRTAAEYWAREADMGAEFDAEAERQQIKLEADAGITLPGMPIIADPVDPTGRGGSGDTGPGASRDAAGGGAGGTDLPDPTSAAGAAQIRQDDTTAKESQIDNAARLLSAAGHIVVLRS